MELEAVSDLDWLMWDLFFIYLRMKARAVPITNVLPPPSAELTYQYLQHFLSYGTESKYSSSQEIEFGQS